MKVTLNNIETVAQNIKTFWLTPESPIRYEAGQFIELTVPHDNPDKRGIKRWFTLSSSPTEELLAITTKYATDTSSSFKESLFNLKPGAELSMSAPMGDFVLPKDKTLPLLFVAGGIGITPIRSMLKYMIDTGEKRPVHILYGARKADDIAFTSLLEESGADLTIVLSDQPGTTQYEAGSISSEAILAKLQNNDIVYLSGPEKMVENIERELKSAGVNKHQLVLDFFPNYPEY